MSNKVRINIEAYLPEENATDEEVDAWINFELGLNGGISLENKLTNHDLAGCSTNCDWEYE